MRVAPPVKSVAGRGAGRVGEHVRFDEGVHGALGAADDVVPDVADADHGTTGPRDHGGSSGVLADGGAFPVGRAGPGDGAGRHESAGCGVVVDGEDLVGIAAVVDGAEDAGRLRLMARAPSPAGPPGGDGGGQGRHPWCSAGGRHAHRGRGIGYRLQDQLLPV